MAGYHKKRRRPGPSKNEEKIARGKEEERRQHPSNWLSSRYDGVASVAISYDLIGTHGEIFAQETRRFGAQDSCDFTVQCPGLCGGGSFDMGPKVSEAIAGRVAHSEFSGICQNKTYAGSSTICGVTLKCRLDAVYKPISAPPPAPAAEPAAEPNAPA